MSYLDIFSRRGICISVRSNGKLRLEPRWLVTGDLLDLARNHRDELTAEIQACGSSIPDDSTETVPDYHFLMVATNLDSWEADDPRFGYEVMLDTSYRQLDATYYAWLRHRMENVSKSHDNGAVDGTTFNALREQFNVIHTWAVIHIGEEVLRTAIRTTNVKTYIPPSEQTFAAYRKTWDDAWDAYERRAARQQPAPSNQAAKLEHALATRGYAGIRSSIIDDIVVFVRDDSVVVPPKWASKVTYTIDELTLMVGSTPEAVKQIHDVKRIFGGKVVPIDESDSRIFPDAEPVATTQKPQQPAMFGAA